jgi:hypothetical protein
MSHKAALATSNDLSRPEETRGRDLGRVCDCRPNNNCWTFEKHPEFPDCTPDTVNGFHYLHASYTAADKKYTGKVRVPNAA